MRIKINGIYENIPRVKTVMDILKHKNFRIDRIIIEHNRIILKPEELKRTKIRENDSLEIVSFVGGG